VHVPANPYNSTSCDEHMKSLEDTSLKGPARCLWFIQVVEWGALTAHFTKLPNWMLLWYQ